jgi:DNA-binding CsgD family transcriptional regulator
MNLSEKEREVLQYACQGLAYKEIAPKVGTSPGYVGNILERLRLRFGCANTAALTSLATEYFMSDKSHPDKVNKGR